MNKRIVVLFLLLVISANGLSSSTMPQGRDGVIDYYEVNGADIRSVCKQISLFAGVDIVVSEKVSGTISLSVSKKTWVEILQIVCRLSNLAASNEGSYIYVLSSDEQSKRMVENATSFQATQEIGPLKRDIIKISHTTASEIESSIKNLLSARGKITVVAHTNALIILDTEDNIEHIRKMVKQLDIETAQISISCKIIEVSSGVIQRMGVNWGYNSTTDDVQAQHLPKSDTGSFISGAIEKVTYGILTKKSFSAALEYLYGDNKGEIVAQPQITTIDNKEARIFMGQQIPVKYLDEAGNTVVQMIDAGTELIVKPHISGEGRILLELKPKKESYIRQADGTPVINQQSASTNVVVNNGETVVIAGLTSNEITSSEAGIPILKDIPLLGNLFKKSDKNHEKKDLIIFVTPYILNSGLSATASGTPKEMLPVE